MKDERTEATCEACGCDGHRTPGVGRICEVIKAGTDERIDICEDCLEDVHRCYSVVVEEDEVDAATFATVRRYVNIKRKSRIGETPDVLPTLAMDLALAFVSQLTGYIGDDGVKRAAIANAAEINPGICHSHDECDANQAMLNAWENLFGADEVPATIREGASGDEIERDDKLWDTAWTIAKLQGFWADAPPAHSCPNAAPDCR